jgi:hypothetical protein
VSRQSCAGQGRKTPSRAHWPDWGLKRGTASQLVENHAPGRPYRAVEAEAIYVGP